jgi:hypothetical protein
MAHIAPYCPFHSYLTGEPDVSPELIKSLKMQLEFSYWEAAVLPLNYARAPSIPSHQPLALPVRSPVLTEEGFTASPPTGARLPGQP